MKLVTNNLKLIVNSCELEINSFSYNPSSADNVVLVDEHDRAIGVCEKLQAHQQALLHRAFSIFIFRHTSKGLETLLQKRADGKYHSAGLWTNAVCSHPRQGEETLAAAHRRLDEELGFTVPLTYISFFIYKAVLGQNMNEHEYDHVYYGIVPADQSIPFNRDEVSAVKWWQLDHLQDDLQQNPQCYTAWLSQALALVNQHNIFQGLMIS